MSANEIEDTVDKDVGPGGGIDVDDENLRDDELLDDEPDVGDIDDDDTELLDDDDDDDDDDDSGESKAAARTGADDDDDELDPEDIEADLDTILKGRLASSDDAEESEDQEGGPVKATPQTTRQENEFHCQSCFLLVDVAVARSTNECPHCGAPIDSVPA